MPYEFKDGTFRSTDRKPIEEIMLADYYERILLQRRDKVILYDSQTGEACTGGQLLAICRRLAAHLQVKGLRPNDMVVCTAETSIRACCTIMALILCQATLIIPKHASTEHELGTLLKDIPLKMMLGDKVSAPKLRRALQVLRPVLAGVVSIDDDNYWSAGLEADFKKPAVASDPKTAIFAMTFTSGSTGPSKAVCISHFNIVASQAQLKFNKCKRFLLSSPLSHLSGLLCLVNGIAQGVELVVASENIKNNIEDFSDMCEKYNVNSCLAMPVVLNKLIEHAPRIANSMRSVEMVFTGGSVVGQSVIDKFHELYPQIEVEQVFAMTECVSSVLRGTDMTNFKAMQVTTNAEIRIVDQDTGKPLGPNETGMLLIRAPSVAIGYFNNTKATRETFGEDGWLISGDLAYYDTAGNVFIVDRAKQMIKCLDSQVAPADLEIVLSDDPDVKQVLVVGLPHEHFGEAPTAFVAPVNNADLSALRKRLFESVKIKCAYFKQLHGGIFFVPEIPKTDTDKFSRKDVLKMNLENQLTYLD